MTEIKPCPCGQGADLVCLRNLDYEAEGYDPYWQANLPEGKFDIILCTYVLNVVSERSRSAIIDAMSQ